MTRSIRGTVTCGCAMGLLASQALAAGPVPLDRTILPIQEPARPLYKEIDARKVAMPPRFEVKAPAGAPNVVIVLVDDLGFGVPGYAYNFLGLEQTSIVADKPLAPGKATVKFDFAYDGGGPGKGGMGTLYVNGEKVAEGRIEHTQPGLFSADETADVGIDLGTPVVEAIGAEHASKFKGHIPKVTVEVRK